MSINKETANVTLIKENEDGSAVYEFDFPPEALDALTRLGILTAKQREVFRFFLPCFKTGIEEAKKLEPEYNAEFTDEIKELAKKAGFCMWENESWKPAGAVIDWSSEYDEDLVKFYHLVKEKYDN